jgi:hypothetical protein
MNTTAHFSQRTTSPVARRLHAFLRYCPGYRDENRVQWVVNAVLWLSRSSCFDLPIGCRDAALALRAAKLPVRLTRVLSIDQACKLIVEIGRSCASKNAEEETFRREQARKR